MYVREAYIQTGIKKAVDDDQEINTMFDSLKNYKPKHF